MKILVVFGTRPEAIKMAPVVQKLKEAFGKGVRVCVTAQHRGMLDQMLAIFNLKPDYDLDIMKENQTLSHVTANVLKGIENVLSKFKPDLVLVHGDTTTTFAGALAAFYHKIPSGHVEAGLRSHDNFAPWPEEMNRKLAACLVDFHFAPTELAKENLLAEDVDPKKIFVTGNTVVDALLEIKEMLEQNNILKEKIQKEFSFLDPQKKLILVTGHRRENFGKGLEEICVSIKKISERKDVQIVYPVHLNPNVQNVVQTFLKGAHNIFLIPPQDYVNFVFLMEHCYLILTDSGGIQEEAPTFSKPVLVMRNVTERKEAIQAGTAKLVGTSAKGIVDTVNELLDDSKYYETMSQIGNPFGDGFAASRIVDIIRKSHGGGSQCELAYDS